MVIKSALGIVFRTMKPPMISGNQSVSLRYAEVVEEKKPRNELTENNRLSIQLEGRPLYRRKISG